MSGENQRQDGLALEKNKTNTETIAGPSSPVTSIPEVLNPRLHIPDDRPCGFVVAQGASQPFCDEPALKGSSYCAVHHALCTVPPDSAAAERFLREQDRIAAQRDEPPPELAHLMAAGLTEIPEESDQERLAGIELARERDEVRDN
jgi:hypothetical protein